MAEKTATDLIIREFPEELLGTIRRAAFEAGVTARVDGSAAQVARWALVQFARSLQPERRGDAGTHAARGVEAGGAEREQVGTTPVSHTRNEPLTDRPAGTCNGGDAAARAASPLPGPDRTEAAA